MHIKPEGMTQFDILHTFVEKFSELRGIVFLSSTQSSQNLKFI